MFNEIDELKIFFEEPSRQFNVREVARILKINPATASKKLKDFTKKGLLKYQKERIYDLYQADIDNVNYRDLKVYYNLLKIRFSNFIEDINRFYLMPTIIFFGSASNGYDTEESDFDFVIVSEIKKEYDKKKEFEKIFNRKLQIFPVKNLKELKNEHLINSVLNGIVLQGEIKWI
jgi:predicted nucleotidyltransferase